MPAADTETPDTLTSAPGAPESQPSGIDPRSIRPEVLMQFHLTGRPEAQAPEIVHDDQRGQEIQRQAEEVVPEGLETTTAAPAETVEPSVPVERTFEEDVEHFKKGDKRMRLGALPEDEIAAAVYFKRNPDCGGLIGAYKAVHGAEAAAAKFGVTPAPAPAAATETTNTPEAETTTPLTLDELDARIEQLEEELDAAKETYDYAAEEEKSRELRAAQKEWRKLSRENLKAAAKAPGQVTTDKPAALPDGAIYQSRFDADIQALVEKDKAVAEEQSPIYLQMQSVHERLKAENSNLLYELDAKGNRIGENPLINSVCYDMAKAELKIAPKVPGTPPVTRTVPGPASATPRSSPASAPKVDVAAWARSMSPHQLARIAPVGA